MIKGMHHVGISVSNLEQSIHFYTNVLGMEMVAPPFPLEGSDMEEVLALDSLKARMCVVRQGSLMLELFAFTHPKPASKDINYPVSDRGITHFGIEVADIDSEYERLSAAGVRFHSPVKLFPNGIKAAYGRDLDGNVFEMLELASAPSA